jgi:hypothetical protein
MRRPYSNRRAQGAFKALSRPFVALPPSLLAVLGRPLALPLLCVSVRVIDDAFRWRDAAIGVGAALGLVLVIGGLLIAARHESRR